MFLQEIVTTSLLELVAGFGYLLGHFLLSGWIVKIIGGSAWTVFLFQNENNIFMAVTIVIVLAMVYGFYKWKVGRYDERTGIDVFFEYLAGMVALFMIGRFVLSGIFQLGSAFETVIVIAEILGTVLLARKRAIGWYFYIVMSSLAGILVIFINPSPAIVLGVLEMASIYYYIKGIQHFNKIFPVPLKRAGRVL